MKPQNYNVDTWVELDEDLITSDVCIRCGMCCKTTWAQPGKSGTVTAEERLEYLQAIFDDRPEDRNETTDVKAVGNNVHVVNWCRQLDVTDEFRTCKIYENRPQMCRNYNCFREANGKKRLPQYYDFIKNIIDKQR